MIKQMPIKTYIDKVSNYDDFINLYSQHQYEKLFIDFSDPVGREISHFIKTNHPKQSIVLLNEHYNCLALSSCQECQENLNADSLIKPFTQGQIIKVITNHFECESFNKSQFEFTLAKIKKQINQDFPYVKYDNSLLRLDSISDSLRTSAVVSITDMLLKNDIKFSVDENHSIKIVEE